VWVFLCDFRGICGNVGIFVVFAGFFGEFGSFCCILGSFSGIFANF